MSKKLMQNRRSILVELFCMIVLPYLIIRKDLMISYQFEYQPISGPCRIYKDSSKLDETFRGYDCKVVSFDKIGAVIDFYNLKTFLPEIIFVCSPLLKNSQA